MLAACDMRRVSETAHFKKGFYWPHVSRLYCDMRNETSLISVSLLHKSVDDLFINAAGLSLSDVTLRTLLRVLSLFPNSLQSTNIIKQKIKITV